MRIPVVSVAAVCGIGAIALLTAAGKQRSYEGGGLRRGEVVRLRSHFDSVLAELGARDVSQLKPAQRVARGELIRVLGQYRDAGVFPHNHDFPGARVPYFRDEHGTLCAMAYLVAASGRGDLVDAIAERRNNAYIPELADDLRLRTWLDSVGLTVAEAARIQPTYQRPPITVVQERDKAPYVVPSLALGLPAVVASVMNWRAPRDKRPDAALFVGALSGAASAILGGAILADEPDHRMRTLGVADVTVGSAAVFAALQRSIRSARGGRPQPPVAARESRFTIDVVPARHGDQLAPAGRVQIRF